MKWYWIVLLMMCVPLASHAEDCDEGLRRFMIQLKATPASSVVQTQVEKLQNFVDQRSPQELKDLLSPWEDHFLKGSPGHLPGLSPDRKGISFLNLDYIEMVMVLNHIVYESIVGRLAQFTAEHPGMALPEPHLQELQAYLVLLKFFSEESDPFSHVLTQLEKEAYFFNRPVPREIKDQLIKAYDEPLTMTEQQRLTLLTSWEDRHLGAPGYLPGVAPQKNAGKRFLELDYQARRQVITNIILGHTSQVEAYREAHPDQPLPKQILDLFRVETILRMYYKPKFNDPLFTALERDSVPSQILAQIRTAQDSILVQRDDLKHRMVKQWEDQQFKEEKHPKAGGGPKGYLMGLDPKQQGERFAQLSYGDKVNVLRNFASTLQTTIRKHREAHPSEYLLPTDILLRIQVYRLLIAQLNDWEMKQRGAQDSLQEVIAQLSNATVSTNLIRSRQAASSFSIPEKSKLLTQWEDAEFEQFEHLPGLHHDSKYVGERFRTLSLLDQQVVINNLAQRIQDWVTPHLEQHPGQPQPSDKIDEKIIQQVFVYQILLDASRGGLPQD